jgi:hypothetical protein
MGDIMLPIRGGRLSGKYIFASLTYLSLIATIRRLLMGNIMLPIRGGRLSGQYFFASVTFYSLDPKDTSHYHYIYVNNILSYIFQTQTGMLPEDNTVQKEVWTHLGMTSLYHKWYNNREGITLGLLWSLFDCPFIFQHWNALSPKLNGQ